MPWADRLSFSTKSGGYPGKRLVVGVHGSFSNIALLLGKPKGTSIKELFYELVGRWGSDQPLINRLEPEHAPVHENRLETGINLYDLLPLYRINALDGGFYIAKANIVSRDPRDPDNFAKQNVGILPYPGTGPGPVHPSVCPVSRYGTTDTYGGTGRCPAQDCRDAG